MLRKCVFLAIAAMLAVAISCKEKNADKPSATVADTADTFTDTRDGQKYKTVQIGEQVWMAENLNYEAEGSKCYEDEDENCAKYGRLYNWATAQTACPAGWHLPGDDEWTTLENTVGGRETAGRKLKSTSGWNDYEGKSGNGTDEYRFSALPGGSGYGGGDFNLSGYGGGWWSATENDASNAWYRYMGCNLEIVGRNYDDKSYLFSVRCVQDSGEDEKPGEAAKADNQGTLFIDETCFIVIYPKREAGYENVYGYYSVNAIEKFEEIGIESNGVTVGEEYRYLSFALDNGKSHVIDLDLKDEHPTALLSALLYKKGAKPIPIEIGSENPVANDWERISTYLGIKSAY